jgi:hypothetical protein
MLLQRTKKLQSTLLSFCSQILGMLQFLLILLQVKPGVETDHFLYLFSLGFILPQIVLDGFLSPSLISQQRINKKVEKFIKNRGGLIVATLILGMSLLSSEHETDSQKLFFLTIVLSVNAHLQYQNWYLANLNAVAGNPLWKSGLWIPANLLATAFLAFSFNDAYLQLIAMSVGLFLGNIGFHFAIKRVGIAAIEDLRFQIPKSAGIGLNYWFLGRSTLSYSIIFGIQTLSMQSQSATLTLITIPSKIVSGFTSIFINSILPFYVNLQILDKKRIQKTIYSYLIFSLVVDIAIFLLISKYFPNVRPIAMVTAAWITGSTAAAFGQNVLLKFRSPKINFLTVLPSMMVFTILFSLSRISELNFIVICCAYTVLDCLTACIQFWAIGFKRLALIFGILTCIVTHYWFFH